VEYSTKEDNKANLNGNKVHRPTFEPTKMLLPARTAEKGRE
jgi:hypothetical protein